MLIEKEFQEDIIGLIRKHFPKALQGNVEQADRCASMLAVTMGGMLAQSFRLNGPVLGRTMVHTMIQKVIETATAIDSETGDGIKSAIHDVRGIQ